MVLFVESGSIITLWKFQTGSFFPKILYICNVPQSQWQRQL